MSKWLDHSSILGKIGGIGDKYLNPVSWVTGGKSTKLTSEILPEKVNAGLSTVMKPFEKIDKTINPVRKIKLVDRAGDIIASKPGDALALTAGAVFGGAAALGSGAGSAAGGTGGGLVSGGTGAVAGEGGMGLTAGVEGGTAMGSSAGTLGAADSSLASAQLGLTAGDVGGAGAASGGGLVYNAAQDSQLANVQGNLSPVTTDDTLNGLQSSQQSYHPQMQQKKQRQQAAFSPIPNMSAADYQAMVDQQSSQIAQSSKGVKTRGATSAALASGVSGKDMVSTNGVHVAAIQELHKQVESLGKQIAAAKAKRTASKGA